MDSFLHGRFLLRQLFQSPQQSAIFVLCVALSVTTLAALRGFGESVNRVFVRDAKQLIAADVVVRSNYILSLELEQELAALQAEGTVEAARTYEFYSVVRPETQPDRAADQPVDSLLANLKVVEPGYPFWGTVELASGADFAQVLSPGSIVAEPRVLERLGVNVGDRLRIGEATLTIRDVVTYEPDRPVNFFALGPRIFVAAADLEALDLVKPTSRVTYSVLLRAAEESRIDAVVERIRPVLVEGQESVADYRTAESGLQRFYTNFLNFLSIVGIFTLVLAGVGIQSALGAYLRERRTTVAVIRTLGATRRFVYLHFYAVVLMLGAVGTLLGVVAGYALQGILPGLLAGLLPANVPLTLSPRAVGESILLGGLVVAVFTFLPLYELNALRPGYIFRKELDNVRRGLPFVAALAVVALTFTGLTYWQLDSVRTTLYLIGGVVGLLLAAALLAEVTLRLLRDRTLDALALRQALRGLFRPGSATRAIIVALSAALGVLFCIYLIERNLNATFVQSYPEDAPNLFFVDIQPDQVGAFADVLAEAEVSGSEASEPPNFYPVVRGSVAAVNGARPVQNRQNAEGRDWQFVLSYRDELLDDETVIGGGPMFSTDLGDAQVSVLDDVHEFFPVRVGDRIIFRIQGVPLEVTVSSMRTRVAESVQPIFTFVFPSATLRDAPQTLFVPLRVEPEQIAPLQNRVAAAFPNVNGIDVTAAIRTFTSVAQRLSNVVRFFMAFSLAAGLLIVVSSIYATRYARIQEAAYYKVLGATTRFVARIFTMENALLGLLSGALALVMAQVGAWYVDRYLLEIEHRPYLWASAVMVAGSLSVVAGVGAVASRAILRAKPLQFLREQAEEE